MNQVYAYNPQNQRYTMEFDGNVYHFTYDLKTYAVINAWNESGKLIARSYKGFRNKLGIVGSSPKASEFVNILKSVSKIAV